MKARQEGLLFLKKKKQKDFAPFGRSRIAPPVPDCAAKEQKFFGSFFQKRTSFLLRLMRHVPSGLVLFGVAHTAGPRLPARGAKSW
jgi:hypothetical protein